MICFALGVRSYDNKNLQTQNKNNRLPNICFSTLTEPTKGSLGIKIVEFGIYENLEKPIYNIITGPGISDEFVKQWVSVRLNKQTNRIPARLHSKPPLRAVVF